MQQEKSIWGMIGLPMIYHDLGKDNESDAVLSALIEQYGQGWAYNIAHLYACRGDIDLAFEWLDKAMETKTNKEVSFL